MGVTSTTASVDGAYEPVEHDNLDPVRMSRPIWGISDRSELSQPRDEVVSGLFLNLIRGVQIPECLRHAARVFRYIS